MPTQSAQRTSSGPRAAARTALVHLVAAAVLLAGFVTTAGLLGTATPAARAAAAAEPRTWVVDAVDDMYGNRWESADTGGSSVTIQVGDTVEWQFDPGVAAQEHDLTSQDSGATWEEPVQEYRVPGGDPVRRTFTEPGVYHYLCSIHGTVMKGTVVVVEEGSQPPSVTASATPTSGAAPLDVAFSGEAADDGPGLSYSWDFGDGSGAATAAADHTYRAPGTYTATLTVTDSDGSSGVDTVDVVVTGDEPALPAIRATATPATGGAPLDVALSTEITTGGTFSPFADGLTAYPGLTGTAELVRSRGETHASLEVTGLKPEAHHMVHVHEQPCSASNGGAHFRFDEDQPFAEDNEIWLPFDSDDQGRSGLVAVTQPQRAGLKAVSIVIHDPDNPAKRIGCADLGPGTADLAYAWDFGDGATGAGPDPDHTYTGPGTYEATVTVGRAHAGHDGPKETVAATVEVVVEDVVAPVVKRVRPKGVVRDRTPTLRARVRDASSEVRKRDVVLRVDGKAVRPLRYDRDRGRLAWTSRRALSPGRHLVRLSAADTAGNRTVETWRFRVRR